VDGPISSGVSSASLGSTLPFILVAAVAAGIVLLLVLLRHSHGRRATAIKEVLLRPPSLSQLARALAHKVQLMRGAKELTEQDMKPIFVPAAPQPRAAQEAGVNFSTDDIDDDSFSSDEDPDVVFRPFVRPLALEDQVDAPELYEEEYGRNMVGPRHLELHEPMADCSSMVRPSTDLLLTHILDRDNSENDLDVPLSFIPRDDGVVAYNYSQVGAIHPADASPACSMAAILRERYTRQRLQREQLATQVPDSAPLETHQPQNVDRTDGELPQGAASDDSSSALQKASSAEQAEQLSVLHPTSTSLEGDVMELSLPLSDISRGLPRRPLLVPSIVSSQRSALNLDETVGDDQSPLPLQEELELHDSPGMSSRMQPRRAATARQPSFAQRQAEARALTPGGADGTSNAELYLEGQMPLPERLPPPAAVQGTSACCSDTASNAGMPVPPTILRERRDLDTALYRI